MHSCTDSCIWSAGGLQASEGVLSCGASMCWGKVCWELPAWLGLACLPVHSFLADSLVVYFMSGSRPAANSVLALLRVVLLSQYACPIASTLSAYWPHCQHTMFPDSSTRANTKLVLAVVVCSRLTCPTSLRSLLSCTTASFQTETCVSGCLCWCMDQRGWWTTQPSWWVQRRHVGHSTLAKDDVCCSCRRDIGWGVSMICD
jgi:hypothetical protein